MLTAGISPLFIVAPATGEIAAERLCPPPNRARIDDAAREIPDVDDDYGTLLAEIVPELLMPPEKVPIDRQLIPIDAGRYSRCW